MPTPSDIEKALLEEGSAGYLVAELIAGFLLGQDRAAAYKLIDRMRQLESVIKSQLPPNVLSDPSQKEVGDAETGTESNS